MAVDSAYNLGKAGNKKKYRVKKKIQARGFLKCDFEADFCYAVGDVRTWSRNPESREPFHICKCFNNLFSVFFAVKFLAAEFESAL